MKFEYLSSLFDIFNMLMQCGAYLHSILLEIAMVISQPCDCTGDDKVVSPEICFVS